MKITRRKIILLLCVLLLFLLILSLLRPSSRHIPTPEEDAKSFFKTVEKAKPDFMRALTSRIQFYGKVIDQLGNPVIGAEITGGIHFYDPAAAGTFYTATRLISTMTDESGSFSFNTIGKELVLRDIKIIGYDEYESEEQFSKKYNYANYKDDNPEVDPIHKPDKQNPIVFHMRKKEKADLLLCWQGYLGVKNVIFFDNKIYYYNMFSKNIMCSREMKTAHFLFQAIRQDENNLKLTIKATKGVGIQEGSKRNYIAPESGYVSNIDFCFRKSKIKDDSPGSKRMLDVVEALNADGKYVESESYSVEKYLFVSLEDNKYFGRIKMTIKVNEDSFEGKRLDGLSLDMDVYVNPQEGHRVLEYDEKAQYTGKFKDYAMKFPIYAKWALMNLGYKPKEELEEDWAGD